MTTDYHFLNPHHHQPRHPSHFQYLSPHILVRFVNNSGWICMCPNLGGKVPSLDVLGRQVSSFHLLLFPTATVSMNSQQILHCPCCFVFVFTFASVFVYTPAVVYMNLKQTSHRTSHMLLCIQMFLTGAV